MLTVNYQRMLKLRKRYLFTCLAMPVSLLSQQLCVPIVRALLGR